jgi:predicted nucleotidyltransferase
MTSRDLPSGRFVLRLPPPLHAQLAASARANGISLNEYCARSLARAEVEVGEFGAVVAEAISQLGPELVAVAVFGSYARGTFGADSDVDMLLVVSDSVRVDRSLYAPWDELELRIEGHRVEPHYVRMRAPGDALSGFWAEVALDGMPVYDPSLDLTRELVRIRRAILSGVLVRRSAGGRSWWTAA